MKSHHHAFLAVTAAIGLSVPSAAQQELYTVGRFNQIYLIEDHQTTSATAVPITVWGSNGSFFGGATGLDVDPVTGDFLILSSPLFDPEIMQTDIVYVDRVTGAGNVIMSLPSREFSGLDRRWDGQLYTVRDRQELWLLDLDSQTWIVETLDVPLVGIRPSLAIDPRGQLLSQAANQSATVDPVDGGVTPSAIPDAPNYPFFGNEYDSDGSIYLVSITAQFLRFDPNLGVWETILDGFQQINYAYDLAFRNVVDGSGFSETCSGQPNSTGLASTLELLGTATTGDNDLELFTRNLPPATFAYYLVSEQTASLPVGDGVLCLGSPLFRFNSDVLVSDPSGMVRFPLDLTQLAGGQVAMPGDTHHFQLWHRDFSMGGPTSNLSAAVGVTFE